MDKYDVIIVGAGPAGLAASKILASHGKKVLIIDKDPLGGTCLNYGCMPTKFRLKLGKTFASLDEQRNMVASLNRAIEKSLLKVGIDVKYGWAHLKDEHRVVVDKEEFWSEYIVLTIGSEPKALPGLEFDGKRIFSAEQLLWHLPQRVKKMQIIGAGPIGIEFAFMFRDLAEKIIICDIAEEILPREDKEIAERLRLLMKKMGIEFVLGQPSSVDESADIVLVGIGRQAKKEEIKEFFGKVNIILDDRGFVQTDEFLRTSVPNIFAAGECIGRQFFANTASFEGKIVALNILNKMKPLEYPSIPRCVFSDPPVASVGEVEGNLIFGSINYPHGEMYYLYPVPGKLKIGVTKDGVIKFVSMIGPGATELLPLFTLAIEREVEFLAIKEMMYVHPTLAEAIGRLKIDCLLPL